MTNKATKIKIKIISMISFSNTSFDESLEKNNNNFAVSESSSSSNQFNSFKWNGNNSFAKIKIKILSDKSPDYEGFAYDCVALLKGWFLFCFVLNRNQFNLFSSINSIKYDINMFN